MVKLRSNPIFVAALVCAAAFYVPLLFGTHIPLQTTPFESLILESNAIAVEGVVASDPVKTAAFGGSYRVRMAIAAVRDDCGARSAARGSLDVYLPAVVVEGYYPGKLRSSSTGAVCAERGELLRVEGRFMSGKRRAFVATGAWSLGWGTSLHARLMYLRARSRLCFKRLMYAWGDAGALILALLSGSREYLAADTGDVFARAGLSHLLALSGMHLTLVSAFAGTICAALVGRGAAQFAQLLSVFTFVWFAGSTAPLLRALLCALLSFTCLLLRMRRPPATAVLSAAFLLHAVVAPAHLYETAFLLSYSALAGLVFLAAPLEGCLCRVFPPRAAGAFAAGLSAQLATAPVSALVFARLVPVGVIASVVVAPLVSGFLYTALVLVVCGLAFPSLASAAGALLNGWHALVFALVRFFARFPSVALS